ncbi:MAG: dihydropteroate synthase, partial [Thermoplasmata archaeon]|nr:dihydropteroate synthase [Thermoplasmata archaeon]
MGSAGGSPGHGRLFTVALHHLSLEDQVRLEQELRQVGGETAEEAAPAGSAAGVSTRLLLATWGQYHALMTELRGPPTGFEGLADEIGAALANFTSTKPRTVHGAHRSFGVGTATLVMGVVNVTPDSFSDGGQFVRPEAAIAQARRLVGEGAALIDIGGESTRPNATPVSPSEEWERIGPVIRALSADTRVPISVDTRHAEVARRAVEAGADLVNDVSGLRDPEMRRVVAETGAAAVVMHLRG